MPVAYVHDGRLKVDGQDLREFGVNTPDLLVRWLGGPGAVRPQSPWALTAPTQRDELFKRLADSGIRFIRFAPFGIRPLTYKSAFIDNQTAFLDAFDRLVASAESHGMALIPSLFFSQTQIPPLFGEPLSAFMNPASRSSEEFERVIAAIVPRYRSSRAIGYWEFGNENDVRVTIQTPNMSTDPAMGTPERWTEADMTPLDYCHIVTARFQSLVRRHDNAPAPGGRAPRAIASGLQGWRYVLSQRHDWIKHIDERLYDDRTETLTIHPYEIHGWHTTGYTGLMPYLSMLRSEMERRGKPMIIGEFGVPRANVARAAGDVPLMDNVVDQIDKSGAQLALAWAIPVAKCKLAEDWDISEHVLGVRRSLKVLSR